MGLKAMLGFMSRKAICKADRVEWVAAWGGTRALGAKPPLREAFKLSLKGAVEITLGKKITAPCASL